MQTTTLTIRGMTCANCRRRIEHALSDVRGVKRAAVNYRKGSAEIEYDPQVVSLDYICSVIDDLGYRVRRAAPGIGATGDTSRAIGLLIIIVALFIVLEHFGVLNLLAPARLAEAGMSLGMLFVIGLLTSVHCVAMCGGLNLSQTAGTRGIAAATLYNLGRVVSYTVVGLLVGAVGAAFTLSPTVQGIIKLIAGVFMLIMGVNMLGIFPQLSRFIPHLPRIRTHASAPLAVGLLNGLMPCGPLQSMQLYALSTGSALRGAVAMFVFSIGTVPLMFGLGTLGNAFGRRHMSRVMAVSAALVCVLGLSMLSQGWTLTGSGTSATPAVADTSAMPAESTSPLPVDGQQLVESTLSGRGYPNITVSSGVPVKWVITAPEGSLTGCNYVMYIPEYGIEWEFSYGENIIEFTPDETGKFTYYCWMGMQRGTITVT